ncbi:MAG: glycosyltransferase [Mariprofundaceae bacterium]|nr:glycosyltransferase [Mariprofundaceae bacterium]
MFGQHNYGDPQRGLGYEYANFIPAFENLGYDVSFFESLNKSMYSDYVDMNCRLLKKVDEEKPDIIFFVLMTYEIWLETLEIIREGNAATLIHWATDDSWKYEQFSRFLAPMFDVHVTTYASALKKAEQDGMHHVALSQWAADSVQMKPPIAAKECCYDVSFVGSTYGNRKQWIDELKDAGISVDAFGYGWPNGSVDDQEKNRIIRESRLSLNLADSGIVFENGKASRSRQIKARVFEVPGAGGVLMTENADHLNEFYRLDEEIIIFENIESLLEKIRFYLDNPDRRDALAQAGYERTQNEHCYEARFEPLFKQAFERRQTRQNKTTDIDFQQFEAVAVRHRLNFLLIILKYILLAPCVLIWGKQRGHRAARRFLFECSWRFFGKKTYSVTNWAGRLFYKHS